MTDDEKLAGLDPNDPFTKARREWAKIPEKKRREFYEKNAGLIDRWQAETDAMAADDMNEEKE